MFQDRTYRKLIARDGLISFQVIVKETDLWVQAEKNLEHETRELVLKYRGYIESYIQANPSFAKTLVPWPLRGPAPKIVIDMVKAGQCAGVGPMASVAGAIAEYVGLELLFYSNEVIVENGGDIFVKLNRPFISSIYAGDSALSLRIGLRINLIDVPVGICTSSGTIGHSYSRGKADAVCVISESCAIADAAATAICNQVDSAKAIKKAIAFGKKISGVLGIAIIVEERFGVWGGIEIVTLTDRIDK
jgi:uncharacterized protein